MDRRLEEKLVEWKPKVYRHIPFNAHHILASENMAVSPIRK